MVRAAERREIGGVVVIEPPVIVEPHEVPVAPSIPRVKSRDRWTVGRIARIGRWASATLAAVGLYQSGIIPELIDQGKKAAQNWMLENGFLKDPKIFDNQDTYGQISPLNSVALPLDVIKERTRIEPGKAIHIGSFFQTPGPAEIKYVKGLPYFGPTSGITNPEDAPEYNKYLKKGVKNAIAFTNIPLGTVVHAPFAGKVSTFETQGGFLYLDLIFTDKDGQWYLLKFSRAKNVEMITPVPKLAPKTRSQKLGDWLDVKLGQPLFSIQSEELVPGNQGFNYYSQLTTEVHHLPNGLGKGSVPIDIEFITEGDKVVVPAE